MGILNQDQISFSVVPLLLRGCKDPIPNVRFCTVKLLSLISNKLDQKVIASKIKPMLANICKDPDRDVQYFSKKAMKEL